jgi:hypothetical protein
MTLPSERFVEETHHVLSKYSAACDTSSIDPMKLLGLGELLEGLGDLATWTSLVSIWFRV